MKKNMKKMNLFLILPLLLFFLAGCGNKNLTNSQNNTNSIPKASAPLTMNEVALHNSATDCWQVIDGQVYNLSPFIASGKHPGGDKINAGCGLDASVMFKAIAKHADKAEANLPNFLLGPLQQ